MSTSNNKSVHSSELYFLIQKFLSSGPLKKTLQVFNNELEENGILPKRIDWEGNKHNRTIKDMEHQFSYIQPDYLIQLCHQVTSNKRKNISNTATSSFLSFPYQHSQECERSTNIIQYKYYVTRYHGVPLYSLNSSFNLVNALRGREVSGPISRQRSITPNLYTSLQIQRTTLGHLSAVYCLLFDHTGKYVITGADDLLIKLWSSNTGRLIASFRGASSEITDIAINLENTLIAAGSIDRIIRVWSLQTGIPIAVLPCHTGSITSVNFCPSPCWDMRYLISTSSDGSIAFWSYTQDSLSKFEFRLTPILYQEKIRPGQAQMICSSFSPGGTFLATGSADHHVRVYYMQGDEGPQRILETEAHMDRVDSIQWAHKGLRFLSGSKDGTAIIWYFERQQWRNICLNMTTKLPSFKKSTEESKKLKVTMVAWNRSDDWVITAVSDYTLKTWKASTGQLDKILTSHTDEVYVIEPHPHDDNVVLSAGHDGQLFVWDIWKGEILFRYLNTIEGQGYGAIFDVKWSPGGNVISASDSHGHILTFGFGSGSFSEYLPKELFFHTDYRPLVRDENHYVLDEQTQIPPHLMPPPFLVDIDGNPYPPVLQRLVPGRENCQTEQLVPNIVIGNEGTQEVIQDIGHPSLFIDGDIRGSSSSLIRSGRRSRELERLRNNRSDWQSDHNIEWTKNPLVPMLRPSLLKKCLELSEDFKQAEIEEYQKQLKLRPHMINVNGVNNIKSNEKKKSKNTKYQTRAKRDLVADIDVQGSAEVSISSENEEFSESSRYSDWMEEEGVNLNPRKRSKRRHVTDNSDESDQEEEEEEEENQDESDTSVHSGRRKLREANPKKTYEELPSTSTGSLRLTKKMSEQYRLSEWLSETKPRKFPYFPQVGDEIVYFIEGHQLYLDAVKTKNLYEINTKDLPWSKFSVQDHEYVKILGIQYEIKPPRLCCLKLAVMDEDGRLSGKTFVVKYHDMPDVLDFFVLKQTYCTAISRNWKVGDKFRCMIDDGWWMGEIIEKSPASELYPNSSFLCYEIKWQNGEHERMSPWDFEPIDSNRMPDNENEALPVLQEELDLILYKPVAEDWPNNDRDAVSVHIIDGLTKVMQLAIAEPFLVPVDLSIYPSYALIIEYPIDLSTIKARFENKFYRRITAAQFDIRCVAVNAEKYNERHSVIVKHARILTELCLRIVKNCTGLIDVQTVYHQLVDTYDSTDTENEVEIDPSVSRTLRSLPNRTSKDSSDWKNEAKSLIDAMWEAEDSIPFRNPVNLLKYPDYNNIINTPMDLGTVKDNLLNDRYIIPEQFSEDMRLIFQNSRTYNTNKRSRIYVMTVRLAAIFEEHIKRIISNWKTCESRNKNNEGPTSSRSTNQSSDSEFEENIPLNHYSSIHNKKEKPNTSLDILNTIKTSTSGSDSSRENEESSLNQSSSASSSDESFEYPNNSDSNSGGNAKYSSDDSLQNDEEVEYSFKRKFRKRSLRRRKRQSSSSSSEESIGHRTRKRTRIITYDSDSDTDSKSYADKENTSSKINSYFSTVSSRGRVRKLTARAQAFLKK